MRIEVIKAVRAPLRPDFVRTVLEATAEVPEVRRRLPAVAACVTVRISGDRELRRLNKRFLDEDRATDVLSFPSGNAAESGYVGDLAISWPAIIRQAAEQGHDPQVEAGLLAVHGFLHLLGWDHITPEEEKKMTELTVRGLGRAGLRIGSSWRPT
jgi:probable rRNA maturation factor